MNSAPGVGIMTQCEACGKDGGGIREDLGLVPNRLFDYGLLIIAGTYPTNSLKRSTSFLDPKATWF